MQIKKGLSFPKIQELASFPRLNPVKLQGRSKISTRIPTGQRKLGLKRRNTRTWTRSREKSDRRRLNRLKSKEGER